MNEQKAKTIQSDTLSILLCNQVHKNLSDKDRAIKISKCCKIIRDRTKDSVLYNACRSVIRATSGGHYADVLKSIQLTENNYFIEYKESFCRGVDYDVLREKVRVSS